MEVLDILKLLGAPANQIGMFGGSGGPMLPSPWSGRAQIDRPVMGPMPMQVAQPPQPDPIQALIAKLTGLEAGANQAHQDVYSAAPPVRRRPTLGTKDLAWGIPALIALLSGGEGPSFAGGLVNGAIQGKERMADQENEDMMRQFSYNLERKRNAATIADRGVQDARWQVQNAQSQRALEERAQADEIERADLRDYRNKTLETKTTTQTLKDRAADIREARKTIFDEGSDVSNKHAALSFLESLGIATEGDRKAAGVKSYKQLGGEATTQKVLSETELLKQKFGFYKQYNPELITRIRAQTQGIYDRNALTQSQKQLVDARVVSFPLDQQAKRAEIYSRIAQRQEPSAKDVTSLYSMNQQAINAFERRRADPLGANPLTPDEEQTLRQLYEEQPVLRGKIRQRSNASGPSNVPSGGAVIDKSGGFTPMPVNGLDIKPERALPAMAGAAVGAGANVGSAAPRVSPKKAAQYRREAADAIRAGADPAQVSARLKQLLGGQ